MKIATLVRIALAVVLLSALGWHVLPLAVWQLHVAPGLRTQPTAGKLRVETVREMADSPPDWRKIELGNVSLLVPTDIELPASCESGRANCFASGDGRAVNVFAEGYLEPYEEMVNLRAP